MEIIKNITGSESQFPFPPTNWEVSPIIPCVMTGWYGETVVATSLLRGGRGKGKTCYVISCTYIYNIIGSYRKAPVEVRFVGLIIPQPSASCIPTCVMPSSGNSRSAVIHGHSGEKWE